MPSATSPLTTSRRQRAQNPGSSAYIMAKSRGKAVASPRPLVPGLFSCSSLIQFNKASSPRMKAVLILTTAYARLALAAPAFILAKRSEVLNLLNLSAKSLNDKASRDRYVSDVKELSQPLPPKYYNRNPLPFMITAYVTRLNDYIKRGLDETASNALLRLANSGHDAIYPVTLSYLDSFVERVVERIDQR